MPDNLLKDVSHLQVGVLFRVKISFGCGTFLQDSIQNVILRHRCYLNVKLEHLNYLLHIQGKPIEIIPEVCLNGIRVIQAFPEGELTGIIK